MFSRPLLLSFLLLSTTCLYAQEEAWNLKGKIVGDENKELPFSTLILLAPDGSEVVKAAADSNGVFTLSHNKNGVYFLKATHSGYQEYRSESFQLAHRDFGIIRLTIASAAMDEVLVQSRQKLVELNANTIIYNVAKSIDAQGISALEVLKKAPGVFVTGDNTVLLNGKAGVLILLDGKQTYLSGQELTDLLKSMPASGIRSIDIMNSPGAKYDAAGSAGIINIKTNKAAPKGFSAVSTTGASYGIKIRQNQDLSFNYRRNRYNFFGSYNHFVGNYQYAYGSDRLQSGRSYRSATDDTDKRNRMGARLGMDYALDKNNTIGILLNGNFIFGGGITQTTTRIGPPNASTVDQTLFAVNDYYFQKTERYNVSLNYKYENAKGSIFNIDADYGSFKKGNGNLQSNVYTDHQTSLQSSSFYRSLNTILIHLKAIKLDYTTPVWKGIVEAGFKYSGITSDNDARFFHVLPSKDSFDNRRSNLFQFTERIASVYASYKKTFGKWMVQGGLRMEHSASKGSLYFKPAGVDSLQQSPRNYSNVFPSFSVSVKPSENHSFSFSYSRRIDRPAYQDLNPFVYLLDELSFWQGNPFLQPQLTHRSLLQYAFKSNTIMGLGFSYTDAYSSRITDTVELVKIVMIPRNLGTQKNLTLTLTQTIAFTKRWEGTLNGTLYRLHNQISFDQYRSLELDQLAGRLSLQQRFKLPWSLSAEISTYINTRRLVAANEVTRGTSQLDLALQKPVFKNRGTLRLAVNDVYKGTPFTSVQQFDGFYIKNYGYFEARQIRLNFTYKFADNTLKGPRSRTSALENENGRIR